MQRCRLGERTVRRLVSDLEGRGLVQVERREGRSSRYRVVVTPVMDGRGTPDTSDRGTPATGGTPANLAPLPPVAPTPAIAMAPTPATDGTLNRHLTAKNRQVERAREKTDSKPDASSEQRAAGEPVDESDIPKGESTASELPSPWYVTAQMKAWAAANAPAVNVKQSTHEFVAYWREGDGKGRKKKNWVQAWRNWLRKDHDWKVQHGWKPDTDTTDYGNEWMRYTS